LRMLGVQLNLALLLTLHRRYDEVMTVLHS
jgi:hypothetical protein